MATTRKILITALLVITGAVLIGIVMAQKVERNRRFDEAVADLKMERGKNAVQKLEPLAKSGHRSAQNTLGWIYAVGFGGVEKNDELAIHWFRLAGPSMRKPAIGEDHAADGELWMAYAFANGEEGAIPSRSESLKWLSRSAGGGNRDAARLLARVKHGEEIMSVLKR